MLFSCGFDVFMRFLFIRTKSNENSVVIMKDNFYIVLTNCYINFITPIMGYLH